MRTKKVCLYKCDETVLAALKEYRVTASAGSREELRRALTAEKPDALIIDLDQGDALDAVVETLEIHSGISVIGVISDNDLQTIITAQRAGVRQLSCKPVNETDLTIAIRKAANEAGDHITPGKTIAVIGASGGVGSTTVTCYLAMAMAELTKSRTAIIDLDLDFGTVANLWDVAPRYTLADIASAGSADKLLLEDAFIEVPCNVGILPRPQIIDQAHTIHEGIVTSIIQSAQALYPHVVIDLPRKLDAVTGTGIQSCDRLLVIVELTVASIHNASRLSEALVRFGLPAETIEFVVNRFRKGVHSVTVESLENKIGKKVLAVLPNHYKSLSLANDLGQPVTEENPVRKAITEVAEKVCGRRGEESPRGWLNGLRTAKK